MTSLTVGEQQIVNAAAELIRQKFTNDGGGHDWYHMDRVWKMAQKIGQAEGANMFIVELAALLHDYADQKLVSDPAAATEEMNNWLRQQDVSDSDIATINDIIANVSFRGLGNKSAQKTLEGKVVQDADRLDAIGAIAVARVFSYGGHKGRLIYNPMVDLHTPVSDAEYYSNDRSGIHHFYDKLLHLKDRINTPTGRKIAEERHQFMEKYLDQFFAEWTGDR